MDNPYWTTKGTTHFIDLESIQLNCFELLNIFEANKALHDSFEHVRAEAKVEEGAELSTEDAVLLRLHEKYAYKKISQLLLAIATAVRTYDDIMSTSDNAEKYKQHSQNTTGDDYIGNYSGSDKFDLREACNKIIHAREVRPQYERVDPIVWPTAKVEAPANEEAEIIDTLWHLTGEIELRGRQNDKEWEATLYSQNFIEIILDRIGFGYPAAAEQSSEKG